MISEIIKGIIQALRTKFDENEYDIYTESVEQGLTAPCFLITCLNPTNELFFNNKYMRTNPFMIQYFPKTKDVNDECSNVIELLYDALEYIKVGDDLTRASKMGAETVDDVLNFSVNYDMFVYKKTEGDDITMNDLKSEVGAKGDVLNG